MGRVILDNDIRMKISMISNQFWWIKNSRKRSLIDIVPFMLENGTKGKVHIFADPSLKYIGSTDFIDRKIKNPKTFIMLINPEKVISKKYLYYVFYHEFLHLTDPTQSIKYNTKYCDIEYNSEIDEKYYGHDIEFRAMTNEFFEGLVNEFKERLHLGEDKGALNNINKNILNYFTNGEKFNKSSISFIQSLGGNKERYIINFIRKQYWKYPWLKKIYPSWDFETIGECLKDIMFIKEYNQKRWGKFLKNLYLTHLEINDILISY